jgi:hypothetical protein
VADGAGDDLVDGRAGAAEPLRVAVGRQIAHQGGDAVARLEGGEGRLEEGGLARSGARDQADDEEAGVGEAPAQLAGEEVVLLQQALADLDDARLHFFQPCSHSTGFRRARPLLR